MRSGGHSKVVKFHSEPGTGVMIGRTGVETGLSQQLLKRGVETG